MGNWINSSTDIRNEKKKETNLSPWMNEWCCVFFPLLKYSLKAEQGYS